MLEKRCCEDSASDTSELNSSTGRQFRGGRRCSNGATHRLQRHLSLAANHKLKMSREEVEEVSFFFVLGILCMRLENTYVIKCEYAVGIACLL